MHDIENFVVEDGVLTGEVHYNFEGGLTLAMLSARVVLEKELGKKWPKAYREILSIIRQQLENKWED